MKKCIVSSVVLAALFIAACNNEPKQNTGAEDAKIGKANEEATELAALSNHPDYQKGLEIVAKSDCATCHRINEKVTGPSYSEIANKYAGMPDTIVTHLASKIIKGGSGVWGQVMMTPHPTVSQADAEAMVKYIRLLKK